MLNQNCIKYWTNQNLVQAQERSEALKLKIETKVETIAKTTESYTQVGTTGNSKAPGEPTIKSQGKENFNRSLKRRVWSSQRPPFAFTVAIITHTDSLFTTRPGQDSMVRASTACTTRTVGNEWTPEAGISIKSSLRNMTKATASIQSWPTSNCIQQKLPCSHQVFGKRLD